MKRTYYLFLLFALILTGCEKSGEQEIPSEDEPVNILDSMTDAWFRDYCLSYYDADHNGEVSPEEVAGVTSLDFSRRSCTSLSGIEYFTGLTMLDVRWSDLELSVARVGRFEWYRHYASEPRCTRFVSRAGYHSTPDEARIYRSGGSLRMLRTAVSRDTRRGDGHH